MSGRRVILIVLDSVGAGALPDAADYGDVGANTLANTAAACRGLRLPNLGRMGLGNVTTVAGVAPEPAPTASWGRMAEASAGKDTVTGHWELAGLVSATPFATYPQGFPSEILDAFRARTGHGVLGNVAASGTEILDRLGPAHQASGTPIVYTSADSVFQIAAHEETVPLEELYRICRISRDILDPYRVARVIARPFVGGPTTYRRTYNRKDFAMAPPAPTVLDRAQAQGLPVVGVGKIHDIFSGRGVGESIHTEGNTDGLRRTLEAVDRVGSGLIFVNLVDFDMTWGHRRDAAGYGRGLEEVDAWLPTLLARLGPSDLLILTADHGCDPTFAAHTDHTREYVPVILFTPGVPGVALGTQSSFTFVADRVAAFLGLPA